MALENIVNSFKKSLIVGALAFSAFVGGAIAQEAPQTPPPKKEPVIERCEGGGYGPFGDNENPDKGVYPTLDELKRDINFLPKVTKRIRTYGVNDILFEIAGLCNKNKLECYIGAWISKEHIENEKEIRRLLKIPDLKLEYVKGLVVGNEVLCRGDMSVKDYSTLVKKVNDATDIPVGIAETWNMLLENKAIAENADFIMVHIHPYWEGISVEDAANEVIKRYEQIKKEFPGKLVMIGETGWPSAGEPFDKAVPSELNQKKFFEDFTRLAKEKDIPYFYFEVFDELWKGIVRGDKDEEAKRKVGSHWGIFYSDGSLKPLFKDIFKKEVWEGIKRPKRKVSKVDLTAPFSVYADGSSEDNHFQPSGYMGDWRDISVDRDHRANPHSGESCTKIVYTPNKLYTPGGIQGWAGIYWQFPVNNWGEYPGYGIKGASKLTFWARGEDGGEYAQFKVGGINAGRRNEERPYEDSLGPVETLWMPLTKEWKQYEIDLSRESLENVSGGFCWVTNIDHSHMGCTIYLDDIKFEK